MIARLTGLLDAVNGDQIVVDVGGVGYLVFASARTLRSLPAGGAQVSLFIDTHVREDHIHLYGFVDQGEREWFRLLLTVQGVGAKVALAILSVLGPDAIAQAIAAGDASAIVQAQGVGAKLAGRIASELKDKAGDLALDAIRRGAGAGDAPGRDAPGGGSPDGAAADAVSALVNLNYRRDEAFGAIARVRQDLGVTASVEALIQAGLKELAS